jgi:tRNA pseudouridine38-40 synthase
VTRYKLLVEYDGAGFVGWQRQTNGPSVQQALEDAIAGFSGEFVRVYGAGRTDAGVHAAGQVAHFDLEKATDGKTVANALNAHLRPLAVAVLGAEAVGDDFHARTSARQRHYLYRMVNRRAAPALARGRAWHVQVELDADLMHQAAQVLVGRHDFTSFRASLCQAASPVKTLTELSVARHGEEILVTARARSFLHHQVRNMVGTLKLVGEGKWSSDDLAAALAARDRAKGGPTAPAHGLCLMDVGYESIP